MSDEPLFTTSREIPLSEREFALLGRLTSFLAIVDEEMNEHIAFSLGREHDEALKFARRTGARGRLPRWSRMVRGCLPRSLHGLVWRATAGARLAFCHRNMFVHALFETEGGIFDRAFFDPAFFDTGESFFRSLRDGKQKPIDDLEPLVVEAARLSRLFAHIGYLLRGIDSPWADEFA